MLADGNQVTESSDSDVKSEGLTVKFQLEATGSYELTIEDPKPPGEAETPVEMDLEQSTG